MAIDLEYMVQEHFKCERESAQSFLKELSINFPEILGEGHFEEDVDIYAEEHSEHIKGIIAEEESEKAALREEIGDLEDKIEELEGIQETLDELNDELEIKLETAQEDCARLETQLEETK